MTDSVSKIEIPTKEIVESWAAKVTDGSQGASNRINRIVKNLEKLRTLVRRGSQEILALVCKFNFSALN